MTSTYKHHNKKAKFDPSKSEECMVCGKIFPRGIIDLARHQTAITLQHLSSTEQSATCSIQCERCGIYFSSDEHVKMHQTQSSCSIKDNSSVLSEENNVLPTADYKSNESEVLMSIDELNNNNEYESLNEVVAMRQQPMANYFTRIENEKQVPLVEGDEPSQDIKVVVDKELRHRLSRRGSMIIPLERKAFFAIVSLLVDPKLLGLSTQLNSENFIQYIPEEHQGLVQRMKEYLLYDCY